MELHGAGRFKAILLPNEVESSFGFYRRGNRTQRVKEATQGHSLAVECQRKWSQPGPQALSRTPLWKGSRERASAGGYTSCSTGFPAALNAPWGRDVWGLFSTIISVPSPTPETGAKKAQGTWTWFWNFWRAGVESTGNKHVPWDQEGQITSSGDGEERMRKVSTQEYFKI